MAADFRGAVRFGVVTNRQVAETLSIKEGSIYLHRRFNSSLVSESSEYTLQTHLRNKKQNVPFVMWSGSSVEQITVLSLWTLICSLFWQMFPQSERNFTAQAICTWVFQHYETILQWLQPPGTKSRLLERELSKGPALLIFLTHNPLGPQPSPLLQQVSGTWGHWSWAYSPRALWDQIRQLPGSITKA